MHERKRLLRGDHRLTTAQKTTITKWVTAEAGGGGDGGDGDGGGVKVACQTACKTPHAGAVAKCTAYNTCVTKTCASSCQ